MSCQPCPSCGHGTCNDNIDATIACTCNTGWMGASCDACAAGYFGPDCQACPACGAHGTCNEGITGNGACTCATGWMGASCNLCVAGYFGANCQACPACVHGTCNEGIGGNGACACAPGWAGALCDTCAPGLWGPNCDQPCTCQHGTCNPADGHCSSCQPAFTGTDCETCTTCRPNLVLYWKFDESMGTTVYDYSGNDFHGAYVSDQAPLPAPSALVPTLMFPDPASLAFNQSNTLTRQAVRYLPADVSALKPANNFTFAAWFRTNGVTDTSGSEVVSMGDAYLLRLRKATATTYQLQFSKRGQTFLADGGTSSAFADCQGPLSTTPVFLDGNWHHFAGVQSSTTGMSMYFDGALVTVTLDGGASSTCANPAAAANVNNVVYTNGRYFYAARNGNNGSAFDFDGNIDEVRVYNRVLTPVEISTLATGGAL
jgi:hypothetical protein